MKRPRPASLPARRSSVRRPRDVLGADAGVAIAADRERRRQLLRDEAIDRRAPQQRLGALRADPEAARPRRSRRQPDGDTPAAIARRIMRVVNPKGASHTTGMRARTSGAPAGETS